MKPDNYLYSKMIQFFLKICGQMIGWNVYIFLLFYFCVALMIRHSFTKILIVFLHIIVMKVIIYIHNTVLSIFYR